MRERKLAGDSGSSPEGGGFLGGVSVGIKISGNRTILDGGVFKDDVALHFSVGQDSKGSFPRYISIAIWHTSGHLLTSD